MESGLYFAGRDDMHGGAIMVTNLAHQASQFPSRWAALAVCAKSPAFAHAAIQPCLPPTDPGETPC
jgi:hypothetical protein